MARPYYCNCLLLFYCRIASYYMAILLYILFIHSSFDGHLDHFQCFATTHIAAANMSIQAFVWAHVFISLRDIPRRGIAGIECRCCLLSQRTTRSFPTWSYVPAVPSTAYGHSSRSGSSSALGVVIRPQPFGWVWISVSCWIPRDCWPFFPVPIGHSVTLLTEVPNRSSEP